MDIFTNYDLFPLNFSWFLFLFLFHHYSQSTWKQIKKYTETRTRRGRSTVIFCTLFFLRLKESPCFARTRFVRLLGPFILRFHAPSLHAANHPSQTSNLYHVSAPVLSSRLNLGFIPLPKVVTFTSHRFPVSCIHPGLYYTTFPLVTNSLLISPPLTRSFALLFFFFFFLITFSVLLF